MSPLRLPAIPTVRVTGIGIAFVASFAVLVRVMSSAYVEGTLSLGGAALLTAAVVAFGLHAWNMATGRGWKGILDGAPQSDRLAALERLFAAGRIRRAEYLEERARLLRGP